MEGLNHCVEEVRSVANIPPKLMDNGINYQGELEVTFARSRME
jgi:hypothetical protein